mmetsp:Transcript_12546/g.35933  ORF Transcript_12546/g.35933 Transcript_12546/m.35933 type:complete len:241 (-) Transcript_12546:879-1601(-)
MSRRAVTWLANWELLCSCCRLDASRVPSASNIRSNSALRSVKATTVRSMRPTFGLFCRTVSPMLSTCDSHTDIRCNNCSTLIMVDSTLPAWNTCLSAAAPKAVSSSASRSDNVINWDAKPAVSWAMLACDLRISVRVPACASQVPMRPASCSNLAAKGLVASSLRERSSTDSRSNASIRSKMAACCDSLCLKSAVNLLSVSLRSWIAFDCWCSPASSPRSKRSQRPKSDACWDSAAVRRR